MMHDLYVLYNTNRYFDNLGFLRHIRHTDIGPLVNASDLIIDSKLRTQRRKVLTEGDQVYG